jgi:hypothetical protein
MTNKIEPRAVFFVSRNKLSFYASEKEKIIDCLLSAEVVQDLEIISRNSLERVLRNWLEQHKIAPGQTALILDSSVFFYQLTEQIPASNDDQAVQAFLDVIPFSEVLLETFPLEQGAYITAANQGFVNPLISTLEKVGFTIVSVSPSFIISNDFTKNPFNEEMAENLINDTELLMGYSFLSQEEVEQKLTTVQPFFSIEFNTKLIVMSMVFLALIGILMALLLLRGSI